MTHRRKSTLDNLDTGFPEQFVGTTNRHPEARVLATPWEPEDVDTVRRARQLSKLRSLTMQSTAPGLDDGDCKSASVGPRMHDAFPASRTTSSGLAPGSLATPVYPGGSRPISANVDPSPPGSGYVSNGEGSMSRPTTAGMPASPGGTHLDSSNSHSTTYSSGNGYSMGHSRGPSHDSSVSTRSSMGYKYTWRSMNPRSLSYHERSGWGSWTAKFEDWKAERKEKKARSRSSSIRS